MGLLGYWKIKKENEPNLANQHKYKTEQLAPPTSELVQQDVLSLGSFLNHFKP